MRILTALGWRFVLSSRGAWHGSVNRPGNWLRHRRGYWQHGRSSTGTTANEAGPLLPRSSGVVEALHQKKSAAEMKAVTRTMAGREQAARSLAEALTRLPTLTLSGYHR